MFGVLDKKSASSEIGGAFCDYVGNAFQVSMLPISRPILKIAFSSAKVGNRVMKKTVSCLCSFIFCRHFQKIVDFTHATRYHNEVNTEDFNEGERTMTILVKDDNGNVVLEREIKKEEVLLKVCVRDDNRMSGTGEYSLEQVCGAYH